MCVCVCVRKTIILCPVYSFACVFERERECVCVGVGVDVGRCVHVCLSVCVSVCVRARARRNLISSSKYMLWGGYD